MPRDVSFKPARFSLPRALTAPVLALGGQMKACLALGMSDRVMVSDDLADLSSPQGLEAFEVSIEDMTMRHGIHAPVLICDAHDGYTSTNWARRQADRQVLKIFHHHAHAGAVAGEFPTEPRWLCFTWDGAGLGPDGRLWGGEALLGSPGAWSRVATFRSFAPPGGEKAAREPWRSAAALAWAMGQDFAPPLRDITLAKAAWKKSVNSPTTSAVGRLFDAAASLLDLVHHADQEAEGPMALETLAAMSGDEAPVKLPLYRRADAVLQADWAPLVTMLRDRTRPPAARAAAFHASLADTLKAQAIAVRLAHGDFAVGLSGGVFQNRLLTSMVLARLAGAGFRAYLPVLHPCHDGGLSYGQVVEAAALS